MIRRIPIVLWVVTLSLACFACEKIEREPLAEGELQIEPAEFLDAIPAEYGDLVAVMRHSPRQEWVSAWFQKPDKTIVVVFLKPVQATVGKKVLVIPRK